VDFQRAFRLITDEVSGVASSVEADQIEALIEALAQARTVFLTGEGRSGLVARAFAARLCHLGLDCRVVGESTTPPAGEGDLLVAVSGSGETPATLHFADAARAAGASVAAVAADGDSRLAALSDVALVVPGRVKTGRGIDSAQMPGALFEQAAFLALEAVVQMLAERRGETHESMGRRHTNLE